MTLPPGVDLLAWCLVGPAELVRIGKLEVISRQDADVTAEAGAEETAVATSVSPLHARICRANVPTVPPTFVLEVLLSRFFTTNDPVMRSHDRVRFAVSGIASTGPSKNID